MNLFDWGARRNDPVTSKEAARSSAELAKYHHQAILRVMREKLRPMAAEEIGDELGMDHVAINRRLTELERGARIYKTEQKHRNRSGRSAFRYGLRLG